MIYPIQHIKNYIVQPCDSDIPHTPRIYGENATEFHILTWNIHNIQRGYDGKHTHTHHHHNREPRVSVQRWKSHLACQKLVKYWPFPIGRTVNTSPPRPNHPHYRSVFPPHMLRIVSLAHPKLKNKYHHHHHMLAGWYLWWIFYKNSISTKKKKYYYYPIFLAADKIAVNILKYVFFFVVGKFNYVAC